MSRSHIFVLVGETEGQRVVVLLLGQRQEAEETLHLEQQTLALVDFSIGGAEIPYHGPHQRGEKQGKLMFEVG